MVVVNRSERLSVPMESFLQEGTIGLVVGEERDLKYLCGGPEEQTRGRLFENVLAQDPGQACLMNQATTRIWR